LGGSTGTGTTFQVTVEFNTPVSKSNLTVNNGLNFFLTVAGNRGKEVHLFGFSPTSKVNTSFFQTYDDNSLNGTYYSTAERFPWALIVPASFRYPLEKIPMHDAFIHYDEWISSNKQSYPDWYQSIEGYVNFDKLFPAAN
jgi:LruC domain-containing protein